LVLKEHSHMRKYHLKLHQEGFLRWWWQKYIRLRIFGYSWEEKILIWHWTNLWMRFSKYEAFMASFSAYELVMFKSVSSFTVTNISRHFPTVVYYARKQTNITVLKSYKRVSCQKLYNLYGSILCYDTMKCHINTLDTLSMHTWWWPHVAEMFHAWTKKCSNQHAAKVLHLQDYIIHIHPVLK
jgi:hypothetical protein